MALKRLANEQADLSESPPHRVALAAPSSQFYRRLRMRIREVYQFPSRRGRLPATRSTAGRAPVTLRLSESGFKLLLVHLQEVPSCSQGSAEKRQRSSGWSGFVQVEGHNRWACWQPI